MGTSYLYKMFAVQSPQLYTFPATGFCGFEARLSSPTPVRTTLLSPVPLKAGCARTINEERPSISMQERKAHEEIQEIVSFFPSEILSHPNQRSYQGLMEGPILAPSPSLRSTTPCNLENDDPPSRACNPIVLNTPFKQDFHEVSLGLLSPSPPCENEQNTVNIPALKKRNRSISCPVAQLLIDETN